MKRRINNMLWANAGGCWHADNEHKGTLSIVANSTFGPRVASRHVGGAIFAFGDL
jgi:hypothetical protein